MCGFKISGFVWKGPYTRSTLTWLTLNWGAAYRAFHKLLGNFLATSRISSLRSPRTHAHQLQFNHHCSSSQLESISRQLWVSCDWVSLGHDQAIAVCGSWFNTVPVLMPFLISDLVGSIVRLPDVAESTESTSGFNKASLGVFILGTIVITNKAFEIRELVNAIQLSSSFPLMVIGSVVGVLTSVNQKQQCRIVVQSFSCKQLQSRSFHLVSSSWQSDQVVIQAVFFPLGL